MKVYTFERDAPDNLVLDTIHDDMIRGENKYITLQFSKAAAYSEKVKLIETIRGFYDIFIILKMEIPNNKTEIEESFSYGIHGVYFESYNLQYSQKELELMAAATELFLEGCVFVGVAEEKRLITSILDRRMIPYGCFQEPAIISLIEQHRFFTQISANLLRYIPYGTNQKLCFSFADRIKMKVLLETMNFRQKLMVKSIDESFNSSGL